MSGELVVKVSWGPRPESPLELAERWTATLGRLTELSAGKPVVWRRDVDGGGVGDLVPDKAEDFAAVVEAGGPEEDADIIGWSAAVVGRWPDGGYAYVRAKGGGSDEYTPFTATLQLFPAPELGSAVGAGSAAPFSDRLPEALAAFAECWEPDTGLTYDRELFRTVKAAFGLRNSQPRCGWSTYLSANRAALVPEELPGPRHATADGGLVLNAGHSTEAVMAAHRILTDAGALEPLPVPAPRPTW
ncbi:MULTISPECIES: hypothetical protein [unclassified Streptomyces]|uniref:hypothetical protein n=1 Tax=unclassified Streptomyces TaxID=2593676 RepID=UPI00081B40FF|nr:MULTISPECIES: hypothetical protein [unclassified Streptomyces]MYX73974.1 hypothetical protein [Streptomyces sp. SID3915]SCD48087.1 hypothetical protein GA0115239_102351 [Streptomyces sp. BpilaLS-43]